MRLFRSIDNRNTGELLAFLTNDILFRFGNADPVKGKAVDAEVVRGFFGGINGVHHKLERV